MAVKGKEVPTYPPVTGWRSGVQSIRQSTCITQLPQASGPAPIKWDARQFLPHHNHPASNYRGSSNLVSIKAGIRTALWLCGKGSMCRLTHGNTRHKKSKGAYATERRWQTSWRRGHLHFLKKSCHVKTDLLQRQSPLLFSAHLEARQKPITSLADVETDGHS